MLERGGVFRGTFPLARKDGTSFQAEQTVSLLNPDQGIDGGVVTIVLVFVTGVLAAADIADGFVKAIRQRR